MFKWILFDLNSFFASCEQQEDPRLRGRPVAVVPTLADSTSVIAASYEAKKFGIKTNTKVSDAKKMCPNLILKTGNHKLYTEYHHRIVKAVEEVLHVKKVLSIDEMACELIGREREPERARQIAIQMKQHVCATVGSEIKSSVGVGPNILIAKIASDMMKPDGLVMIEKDQILNKIGHLPIEDIPGVGAQMKIRLNAHSYFKIADLIQAPSQELRQHWKSIWGLRISRELQGEDLSWRPSVTKKSMSHQHVLPPQLRNSDSALQVILKLTLKAGARLRVEKMKARQLSIYVKCLDGFRYENSMTFSENDDSLFLIKQVQNLYRSFPRYKKPIKVAIALSDLIHGATQLSFFDNPKKEQINSALDAINSRFGANSLFLASTKSVLNSAKTRIAFNHIPELTDEFDEEIESE